MRHVLCAALALVALPSLAHAAPDGTSAEKRMLLHRTAIERDNCPQARAVLQTMESDFRDDPIVRRMLAETQACEGKWFEAFATMMAAKASGVDISEVETKVAAHVALVDVTVSLDGAVPAVSLGMSARVEGASWPGVATGPGRYLIAVPARSVRVAADDAAMYVGAAEERVYPVGTRTPVTLALRSVPTILLARPAGLDRSIVVTVNGKVLADVATPVHKVVGSEDTLQVVATWAAPTGTTLTKAWTAAAGDSLSPWAHVLRSAYGQVVDAGLHAPSEASAAFSCQANGHHVTGQVARGEGSIRQVTLSRAMVNGAWRRVRRRNDYMSVGFGIAALGLAANAKYNLDLGQQRADDSMTYTSSEEWDAYVADVDRAAAHARFASRYLAASVSLAVIATVPQFMGRDTVVALGGI